MTPTLPFLSNQGRASRVREVWFVAKPSPPAARPSSRSARTEASRFCVMDASTFISARGRRQEDAGVKNMASTGLVFHNGQNFLPPIPTSPVSTTGFGRQPERLVIWSLAVIALFATFLRFRDGFSWSGAVRRSAVCFLRFHPLGVSESTGSRGLLLLECLLGWITMALVAAVVAVRMIL